MNRKRQCDTSTQRDDFQSQKNEFLSFMRDECLSVIPMELEGVVLSETSQTYKYKYI